MLVLLCPLSRADLIYLYTVYMPNHPKTYILRCLLTIEVLSRTVVRLIFSYNPELIVIVTYANHHSQLQENVLVSNKCTGIQEHT